MAMIQWEKAMQQPIMHRYQIICGEEYHGRVYAPSQEDAIDTWLSVNGYHNMTHAALINMCGETDIKAIILAVD